MPRVELLAIVLLMNIQCSLSPSTCGNTHLPPECIPGEAPAPPCPAFCVVYPPPRTKQLVDTHICEGAIRQLAVPFVLNFGNFACGFIIEYVHFAVNRLLFSDAFHNVTSSEVQTNRITRRGNLMMKPFDLGESGLQAVPLWFVLLAASSYCDWVFKDTLVFP